MERLKGIKYHISRVWLAGLAFVFIGWFGLEAFQVENGLPALKKLEAQKLIYLKQSSAVKKELDLLQNKVNLMNDSAVDPDMLEEQVRHKLGFIATDEVIIIEE